MKILKSIYLFLILTGSSFANELIDAIKKGDIFTTEKLLKNGADVNSKDEYGNTALRLVSSYGHLEIAKLLLSKGADVNYRNEYGQTALIWASRGGHTEIVKLLLDKGADVNVEDLLNGGTELAGASRGGHTEIVKLLLDKGAVFYNKDASFKVAFDKGYTEIIKLLLDAGANVDLQDNFGNTALIVAFRRGNIEQVKLLLERGAAIDDGASDDEYIDVAIVNLLRFEMAIREGIESNELSNQNLKTHIDKLREKDLTWLINRIVESRNIGTLQLKDIEELLPEDYKELASIYIDIKNGITPLEEIRNILTGGKCEGFWSKICKRFVEIFIKQANENVNGKNIGKLLKDKNEKAAYKLLRGYLEKIFELNRADLSLDIAAKIVLEY